MTGEERQPVAQPAGVAGAQHGGHPPQPSGKTPLEAFDHAVEKAGRQERLPVDVRLRPQLKAGALDGRGEVSQQRQLIGQGTFRFRCAVDDVAEGRTPEVVQENIADVTGSRRSVHPRGSRQAAPMDLVMCIVGQSCEAGHPIVPGVVHRRFHGLPTHAHRVLRTGLGGSDRDADLFPVEEKGESERQAEGRQVKNATMALSHNIGGPPQTCGIAILGMP